MRKIVRADLPCPPSGQVQPLRGGKGANSFYVSAEVLSRGAVGELRDVGYQEGEEFKFIIVRLEKSLTVSAPMHQLKALVPLRLPKENSVIFFPQFLKFLYRVLTCCPL